MKPTPLLLALALVLTLSACAPSESRQTPPVPTPAAPAEPTPAVPELVWREQLFEREFTADDGTVVMSVRYAFPGVAEAETQPVWAKIHDFYAAEGAAYLSDAAGLAGWAADDYTVSRATGEDFSPYSEKADWKLSCQTEDLVSIVRSYYADSITGAAHPANYQFSEQFDLATGERLSLDDFFTDPESARERIFTALAEKAASSGYTRDMLEGAFEDDYFYLTGGSFVFYFQPDTLAPYEAGLLEFSIPCSALEDLLSRRL